MRSLFYLNKYFLKYKWRLLGGILFITISNVFAIFPAQIIRYAFDLVSDTVISYQTYNHFKLQTTFYGVLASILLISGGLVLLMAVIKGLFLFFTRQTLIVMSRLIEYDLKNEIYEHYQKLDTAFYKRNNTGDLMNRISEDVSRVRMYLGPAIMYFLNMITLMILIVATMISVNPTLTFYVLLPLPLLSVSIYYVSNIINKRSEEQQKQLSVLSSYAQESFSGIRVLKAYNRLMPVKDSFEQESSDYKSIVLKLVKADALFMPLMILLIGLSTIITIYIGGELAYTGEVSTGNIAEFVIYVNQLTWPVAALGWLTSITQRAAASQKRINEFLLTEPEVASPKDGKKDVHGDIRFEDVVFDYPESGIRALDGFNLTIKDGESVAIIGRTGSGKSTAAHLLMRMFDPSEGRITIGGTDLRSFDLGSLRKAIGYVPQEVFLFSDTIANNIAFGLDQDEVNEHDIQQAAKQAEVHHNIVDFEKQYDTVLGERGITLSGGQKQRVSIARAIIKKPEILIFDDCLSAVDTETEERILNNLKALMERRTTLIVSHRVSSVKHCDRIIVLEDGKIIESASHDELIDSKGVYYEMFQQQSLDEQVAE